MLNEITVFVTVFVINCIYSAAKNAPFCLAGQGTGEFTHPSPA